MKDGEPEDCNACGKRSATRVRNYPLPPPLSEGSPFAAVDCYESQCWNCGRRTKKTSYVFVTVTPLKAKRRRKSVSRKQRSPRRR